MRRTNDALKKPAHHLLYLWGPLKEELDGRRQQLGEGVGEGSVNVPRQWLDQCKTAEECKMCRHVRTNLKSDSGGDLRLDSIDHGLKNVWRVIQDVSVVAQEPDQGGAGVWRRLNGFELNQLEDLRHQRLTFFGGLKKGGGKGKKRGEAANIITWAVNTIIRVATKRHKIMRNVVPCAAHRASRLAPQT